MTLAAFLPTLLHGKHALVVGGTTGIGLRIAQSLCDHSAHVCVLSRNKSNIDAAVNQIKGIQAPKHTGSIRGYECDVSKCETISSHMHTIESEFKAPVDIIVHCAAYNQSKLITRLTLAEWNKHIATNVTSVLTFGQHLVRSNVRQRLDTENASNLSGGCIVTLGSVMSEISMRGSAAYSSSKSALSALNRSMAIEFGRYNIRCNLVQPGFVSTRMTEHITSNPTQLKNIVSRIALGRIGTVDDISPLVTFLCSDASAYITGQSFTVDGGMY